MVRNFSKTIKSKLFGPLPVCLECVRQRYYKSKKQPSFGSSFNPHTWSSFTPAELQDQLSDTITPLWRIPYETQLKMKFSVNQDILRTLGREISTFEGWERLQLSRHAAYHDGVCCPLEAIKAAPLTTGYRNKCEFSVAVGQDGSRKNVGFYIGQMKKKNVICVQPDRCVNMNQQHIMVAKAYERFLRQSPLDVLVDFQDGGHWRTCTVRSNLDGDLMAVVKIHPQNLSKEELDSHKKELRDFFVKGEGKTCGLTSLYIQESSKTRQTNEEAPYELLHGQPYIYERLFDLKFRISPDSFFQTNTLAAEVLYSTVRDLCKVNEQTTLLDVCCGTGTISIIMANFVRSVIGIEMIGQAVDDAHVNAQLNRIRVHFVGKARVEWDEGNGDDKKYRAETMHFEEKNTLWGKERGNTEGEDPELEAGQHSFPFKFQLPAEGLPCSFEGHPYGYIRYYMKAYIEIPWKFDPATKRAFTISGIPHDLNDLPDIHNPVHGHDDKTVCCFCCTTGPISLDACTDKKGYIPGESIAVTLSIENVTEREIKTKSALMQEVTFTGYTVDGGDAKTITKLITVTEIRHGCCEPHDTMNWSKQLLLIPPVPSTGLAGCPFINIKYYIEVEAVVVGTVFHLALRLPIIIGNIPVRSPAPSTVDTPSVNLPPPSYEVLFSGKTNIRDKDDDEYTHGQMEFAPRYAYYSMSTLDKRKSRPVSIASQVTYYGSL
ncbi:uncharacterized protein [Ptychodera flava]|uniref:uncharacterized protein isoform X2 n=1 Tax=Ptychodera flava TaxID=63121 RepID=UPI00396A04FC